MPAPRRTTAGQIVGAYTRTGSVWKAAQELGLCGQSVWERLRAIGHPVQNAKWTRDELEVVREMAGTTSLAKIAERLGRPYAGVACKVSELGISTARPRAKKVPRGAGFTKITLGKLITELEQGSLAITKFCRSRRMNIDTFVLAAQKYEPERWRAYVAAHSSCPERACDYCTGMFIPSNGKQRTCSKKCASDLRSDKNYFGGKRRSTVGLAEATCQLCGRVNAKGLSSHHVLGKQNDPDNEYLIALCPGCHQLVGQLGRISLTLTEEGWQNLISLAVVRRLADVKDGRMGVHVCVDLDWLTREDLLDEEGWTEDQFAPVHREPDGREGASITVDEWRI